MMPDPIVTDPEGRPLGPNTPLNVYTLGEPANAWALELGVEVAKMPVVMDLGPAGGSCAAAVGTASAQFVKATIAKLGLPVGPLHVMHYHRDDPVLEEVLTMLAEPCPCGRPHAETESEAHGLRAALIAGDDPILVLVQGCILPGGWTPDQANAIAGPR